MIEIFDFKRKKTIINVTNKILVEFKYWLVITHIKKNIISVTVYFSLLHFALFFLQSNIISNTKKNWPYTYA